MPGPAQVQNNFESDPATSSSSLLRKGGSEVDMGNLLTLPVGGGVLYVEPVYLCSGDGRRLPAAAEGARRRTAARSAFEDTLGEALTSVFGIDTARRRDPAAG